MINKTIYVLFVICVTFLRFVESCSKVADKIWQYYCNLLISRVSIRQEYPMAISQRHKGVQLFLLIFLLLFVFSGTKQVSRILQNSADTIKAHLFQNSEEPSIECEEIDENYVETNEASSPEYSAPYDTSSLSLTTRAGRLFPADPNQYLPLVYLPVISPPKIRA
jgi:hypothetical protein